MKIIIVLLSIILFLGTSCSSAPQTADEINTNTNMPPADYCQDILILDKIKTGTIDQCLVINIDGDTLDEIALVENNKITVFSYNLKNQEWQKLWESNYNLESQITLVKGDLNNDHQEELLINQYKGASGATLEYILYAWKDGQIWAIPFPKAHEDFSKYLEGNETDASYFDAKIEGVYLVETFQTYGPDDPHCCPSGRSVSVYYEMTEDGDIRETNVISEAIDSQY
ncbi:LppP/LprE family lipoprotein [Patescibacteria group bacterium]|nr:LppP/LprE family lipoprotein [Patescibacteria group bacterium]MBU1673563.1 LppP/LprE family lipoprotein [Patescibacteria group bacterium]MBU1963641.1 LppP/LprE family lipoprotein [Patescibacteria group bacterium]